MNARLKTALGGSDYAQATDGESTASGAQVVSSRSVAEDDLDRDTEIVTTLEELEEGYQIVKAIACSEVKPHRVVHRDAKSYFAILLDDNNRKPIARLHFNSRKQKYIDVCSTRRRTKCGTR